MTFDVDARIARVEESGILIGLVIAVVGLLPLVIYWLSVGHVSTITVRDAVARLNAPGSNAILVDVRNAEEYRASHIEGAENWPLKSIQSLTTKENVPAQFSGKQLVLICASGIESAWAAEKLGGLGLSAFSVEGGMQSWTANAITLGTGFSSLRLASGETHPFAFRNSTVNEQIAASLSGFFVKSIYMMLALVVIVALWRIRSLDLAALRWSMIFFLIGETFCWINFPIFHEESPLLEYVHAFGMVVCVGLLCFAVIEGMDRRIVHFSDPQAKCSLLGLCRGCAKYKPTACALDWLYKMATVALIVLAMMPLNANPAAISYNTRVFGLPVNYAHPVVNQLYEIRFAPLAAIAFLSLALIFLFRRQNDAMLYAKITFSAAMGFLGFAFMRLALFAFYRDNLVWFNFWEEATELILVSGIVLVLWLFREGLELWLDFACAR